jgi:hypothetical protein
MHPRGLKALPVVVGTVGAILISAAGGALRAAPAVAASTPLDLTGPSVVRYVAPAGMLELSRSIVQGVYGSNGACTFHGSATGSKGTPITEQVEIAFDPATCRSLVVTGRPGASAGAQNPSGGGSLSSSSSGGNPAPTTTGDPSAYVHTWFQDPFGIHVNDVWEEIAWNPAYGCADYYRWSAKNWLQWYSQDGWYVNYNHSGFSPTCYSVEAASSVNFRNTFFCLATDNTYYSPTRIDGYANGGWYASWYWSKDGACSGLLSFQKTYGNGNPF